MSRRNTREPRIQDGGRSAASFLVRFWRGEAESGRKCLQGHVRHLQTGEELHINDPQRLGELVLRELLGEQQETAHLDRLAPWDTAFVQARG